jgi:putative ABC transport system permease protein
MYSIAFKMLLRDRAKYIMLISALTFATLLMTQQTSIFVGLMRWTTALLQNTQVPIWVMDPNVEQVNEAKPLLNTDLMRVRSVSGVSWAVPYYSGVLQARLNNGHFKSIQLIGIDSSSLIGAPPVMLKGRLEDLYQANSVILDLVGIEKLSEGRAAPLSVGDTFEINDHEVRIVGICEAARSFFGYPFVYTTFERALQLSPKSRKNLTYILVHPTSSVPISELTVRIQQETGLKAMSDEDFFWSTIWWFFRNTGIPISFGTTIFLGFIVGLAVAGQTFYSFILENLRSLGALKAMGGSNGLLCRMLLLQAFTVGFIGYGLGVGLASFFGFGTIKGGQPPFYMPYQIPVITFGLIMLICFLTALLAIRRISKLEAAEVFRG